MSEMNWERLVDAEMEWAIEQKKRAGNDGEFRMRVQIIGPAGEIADLGKTWSSEEEKHRLMQGTAYVCRVTNAQAAMITSDMRWCDSTSFCDYFKLPLPKPEDGKEFQRTYSRILNEHGGSMANLPRQVWKEALGVALKGPRVEILRTMPYSFKDGKLVLAEPSIRPGEGRSRVTMLPAWWQ